MEAKDTVIHADGCTTNLGVIGATCNCGAEHQAEISFKAGIEEGYKRGLFMKPNPDGVYENGKRDGIKEVVEWIDREYRSNTIEYNPYINTLFLQIGYFKWQAKLKEWGIE